MLATDSCVREHNLKDRRILVCLGKKNMYGSHLPGGLGVTCGFVRLLSSGTRSQVS